MRVRAAGSFEQAKATVLTDEIEFAGQTWKPNRSLAYVVAELCHTFPARNKNGHSITAATMANSCGCARNQLMDFEHRLAYYASAGSKDSAKARGFRNLARASAVRDRICGTIAAIEFPDKETAIALAVKGKAVAFRILVAVYRRAEGANDMLVDLVKDGASWKTSMEWEFSLGSSALWDGEKAIAWADVPDEVKASAVKDGAVSSFEDPHTLLCGGLDGEIWITGGAFTRNPADTGAKVTQLAASVIKINTGWRSQDDWYEAVASRVSLKASPWTSSEAPNKFFAHVPAKASGKRGDKSLRKIPLACSATHELDADILRDAIDALASSNLPANARKPAKAALVAAIKEWNGKHPEELVSTETTAVGAKLVPLVVGKTDESEGHTHDILMDLSIRESLGHTHWIKFNHYDKNTGTIQGVTGAYGRYVKDASGEQWIEHTHTFRLSKSARADSGATAKEEDVTMAKTAKELAARLRAWAAEMEDGSTEQKGMLAEAAELETQDATQSIAAQIEAKVKAGELVPKDQFEKAVADAKKAGAEEVRVQVEADKAAAKAQADATEKRMAKVTAAKLNPDMSIGKDRTIKTVVASIPADEAGDKQFNERLEEWTALTATTVTSKASHQTHPTGVPPTTGEKTHTNPASEAAEDLMARARKA